MWVFNRPAAPATRIEKAAGGREAAIADALDALAKRFEGPLADAVEAAYARLYRKTDLEALEVAIATGDLAAVFEALGMGDPSDYLVEARQALRQAVVTGAQGEAPRIGAMASLATIYGAGTGVGRATIGRGALRAIEHAVGEIEDAYIETLRDLAKPGAALPKPVQALPKPALALPNGGNALPPGGNGPGGGGGDDGFTPGGKPDFKPKAAVFQFDALNPKVTSFLDKYELDLIVEIDDKAREGIRHVVNQGLKNGANPRDTARDVRQIVGLTERQAAAVGAFRKQLQTFHEKKSASRMNLGGKVSRAAGGAQTFAVDGSGKPLDGIFDRRLRDFRYDKTLQAAMDTGKPLTPAQIDKMVEAYSRKYRRYRSEMIARTESLRATNAGILASWQQAAQAGLVDEEAMRKTWLTAKDERTCPICLPMPALNRGAEGYGIHINVQFNTGHGYGVQMPPLHPACRCTIFIRYVPAALAA